MSKPINRPLNIPGKRKRLTKRMIETAMENSKSNMSAAKWLNVSYNTYKKWAKYYGLFDQHLNQAGVGIKKGWATYSCLLYTSPSPRDQRGSRMPSSA